MTQNANNLEDAALGCFLGALVGDAAGATLEFLGKQPTLPNVEQAMTMPGGGVWNVAPGQITDDGELMLSLAQALAQSQQFNLEVIAQSYVQWVESKPFDIGLTTSSALGCFRMPTWKTVCDEQGYAAGMTQAAEQLCMMSKANGSLMRIAPLGIWGHRLEDEQLAILAGQESRLSHPNESCCQAVACYVLAIASLMRTSSDTDSDLDLDSGRLNQRSLAFERAKNWAADRANKEVRSWLQDAEDNVDIPYQPHVGFIKIAFTHAFRHLLHGSDYVTAIQETLYGGGDTDTNACIVGGLIGAACGAAAIPDTMKSPVLNCNTHQGNHPRPEFLQTTQVRALVQNLLDNC